MSSSLYTNQYQLQSFSKQFQKLDHSYLQSLHQKQKNLSSMLLSRKQQKKKAGSLYQDYVKRQMEMLLKQRQRMKQRNQKFVQQSQKYTKEVKKFLPELIESQNQLKEAKMNYAALLEKMIARKGVNYMMTVTQAENNFYQKEK